MMRPALFAFLMAACATPDAPPTNDQRAASPLVTFDLSDATVEEAARMLAQITNRPVVIAVDARAIASCARLSVLSPRPIPAETAPRLLAAALDRSGLQLVDGRDGWEVRVGSGTTPSECRTPAPPVGEARPIPESPATNIPNEQRDAEIRAGIRVRSESEVELTARAWDLLGDSWGDMSAASQARILPYEVGGALVGLKLFGIRPTSIFAALGLRNGDAVLAIDGRVISSPEQALNAYAGARGHDRVVVTIERQGRRLDVSYRRVAQ